MEELRNKIKNLLAEVSKALEILDLDSKGNKLEELKSEMSSPDFWNDQDKAKQISSQASNLEEQINSWQALSQEVSELNDLSQDKQAEELLKDLEAKFDKFIGRYLGI